MRYGKKQALLCILTLWAGSAQAQQLEKIDTSQPIKIAADSLEVLQKEQKAVFRGNVVAEQGTINLRAGSMTVFYRQSGAQKEGAGGVPADGVSKILVEGDVFLTTPQDTARGDKGVYDVDKKEIRLQGNVVLTREKNVLKGSELEYNLVTGRSLVTGSGGVGVTTGGESGGRVRGLFVPQKQ